MQVLPPEKTPTTLGLSEAYGGRAGSICKGQSDSSIHKNSHDKGEGDAVSTSKDPSQFLCHNISINSLSHLLHKSGMTSIPKSIKQIP